MKHRKKFKRVKSGFKLKRGKRLSKNYYVSRGGIMMT